MLFLHSSNHLENLSQQFADLISHPLDDILEPEQIIVQNAGMGRWLSLQMSQQLGISANYKFLFPAEYMWELLRKVIDDVPKQDPSKPDVLRWRLVSEFIQQAEDYPELDHYLKNELAAWDLANALSPVLDQYLFYRPEWALDWEAGNFDHNDWQARLWQRIIMDEYNEVRQVPHWLDLQENFIKAFSDKYENQQEGRFPERVSFFSVPALSPGYLRLLAELSTKIDVHLFTINPCAEYWGDIESLKRQSKRPVEEQAYYDIGNGLLASLGKQGRDFMDQLHSLSVAFEERESWTEPELDSVLHCLQSDVLHLQETSVDLDEKTSVQIHACHTAMREVEILHDQILAAIDESDDLKPSDIVVMSSAIVIYAPYIDAVFSTAEHTLPFSIADGSTVSGLPEIEVFLKILDLPEQRFNVEAVFELLEYPCIRERFNLDEKQVLQCRHWAKSTNIRWGVSDKMRAASGLPATFEHSWKYGLDRMLLGYMMPSEQLFDDFNLLPFNDIEGSNVQVLSSFKSFTDVIFTLWQWSSQSLDSIAWGEKLQTLVQAIFPEDVDYHSILHALDSVNQQQKLAGFDHIISFSIIKKALRDLLGSCGEERFMSRGVTFCALVPMRSVPFKMVALLGMSDGCFPRQDQRHSFDKMAVAPRKGDRSRRDEDRYLFLESILAARQRLYISFVGQSVQDNSRLPPSVVVSELLDYLSKMTGLDQQSWITYHPLQAFSPRYYHDNDTVFSYVKEYLSLHGIENKIDVFPAFLSHDLAEPEGGCKQISLEQLIHFYKAPARVFLQQRFDIQTFDNNDVLAIREPFALEPFVDTKIRQQIEKSISIEHSLDEDLSRAKGLLPHGDIGSAAFSQEVGVVKDFFKKHPKLQQLDLHQQDFHVELGEFTLSGKLTNLSEVACIKMNLGNYYTGDLLAIWLHHLVMNVVTLKRQETRKTEIYQPSGTFYLDAMPKDEARDLLSELLKGYCLGMQRPLHFFPKPAFKMYEKGKADLSKAQSAWKAGYFSSEEDKFENKLLFTGQDVFNEEFLTFAEMTFGRMKALSVE